MSYLLFLFGGVILGSVGTLVVLKVRNRCHHEFHDYAVYREVLDGECVGRMQVLRCIKCGKFKRQRII